MSVIAEMAKRLNKYAADYSNYKQQKYEYKNYFRIAFSSNYGNAVLWSNNN